MRYHWLSTIHMHRPCMFLAFVVIVCFFLICPWTPYNVMTPVAIGNTRLTVWQQTNTSHQKLHIIVMTYDRSESLKRLLASLNGAYYDGDDVIIHIWIDRTENGELNAATVKIAYEFRFLHGDVKVHNHTKHVGIYGQWLTTWRPPMDCKDIAVFFEDDLSVSPYFYRYLKIVHQRYKHLKYINGFSLNGERIKHSGATANLQVQATWKHPVFMYPVLGTWGFSPKNDNWRDFLIWFDDSSKDKYFRPIIPGNIASKWYQDLSSQGRGDSMWSIWHVFYSWKFHERTVFPNTYNKTGYVINWKEKGLHFSGTKKKSDNMQFLVSEWDSRNNHLPDVPIHLNLKGEIADRHQYL